MVEKAELVECIENLVFLSKVDWLKLDRDSKKTLVKEIADKVIIQRYPKKDSDIVGVDNEWWDYPVLIVAYGLIFAGGFVAAITDYNKIQQGIRL